MTTGELSRLVSSVKSNKLDKAKVKDPLKSEKSRLENTRSDSNDADTLEKVTEQNTTIEALLQENFDEDDQTLDRNLLEEKLLKKIAARKRVKKKEQFDSTSSHMSVDPFQASSKGVMTTLTSESSYVTRNLPVSETITENETPE